MRRRLLVLPLALLAGVLLARRRRRARSTPAPLAPQPAPPMLPAPETRFVSVPWTLVEAPADDPRLTIRCRGDRHMELDRVDAQETPTQVFVTALMRWQPPAGGWFAFEREQEAIVALSGPLGARELVHAPVDEPSHYP